MFRFLWTTDLHLGFLHGKHPKPNIMLEDFDRICQYAISNNILHLIVTGDISDKSALPVDTTAAFISLLKKYNGRLHIYLMRGNHDYLHDSMTSIDLFVEMESLFSTIHVIANHTVTTIDGVSVVFEPYPDDCSFVTEEAGLPPSLVFTHLDVVGGLADNGTPMKKGTTFVPNGDFYCNGHMHTCQVYDNWAAIGPPWQVRMGEDEKRYFAVVEAKYKTVQDVEVLSVDVQKVKFQPSVTLRQVYVEQPEDFQLIHNVQNVLYSVTVAPGLQAPVDYFKGFRNILNWRAERLTAVKEDTVSRPNVTKSLSDLLLTHIAASNLTNDVAAAVANIHQRLDASRASEVRRAVASLSK